MDFKEEVKKIIEIDKCFMCPYCFEVSTGKKEFEHCFEHYCQYEYDNDQQQGEMIDNVDSIPSFCPLPDKGEIDALYQEKIREMIEELEDKILSGKMSLTIKGKPSGESTEDAHFILDTDWQAFKSKYEVKE
jgi:hypothetical protein